MAEGGADRRIRVVHLITRMIVGGAQENTLATVAGLDPERFDVSLVCGPQTGPEGSLLDECAALGVAVEIEPDLVREIDPLRDARALVALRRRLAVGRYDVVHTHSSKAGILGRLAARWARVPHVVHTVHGWGFHDGQAAWLQRGYVAAERRVASFTERLIAVSRADVDAGVARRIAPATRFAVIRSGIEPHAETAADRRPLAERRRALGLPPSGPVVGTVTRLGPQKDPFTLVDAAAQVVAEVPGAHFAVVGDGPLRAAVEGRLHGLGLHERFTLLGIRRDVPEILRCCDVFVSTSRWEGLPRAVLHALDASLPVVATGVGGLAEVVVDGQTGRLVAPGAPELVAAALNELLCDPGRARAMGEAGRKRLTSEFTTRRMIEQIAHEYDQLLGRERACRGAGARTGS